MSNVTESITPGLTFITKYTGKDEYSLLNQALHLGLNMLYQQTAEEAFIDEKIRRSEAIQILGIHKVKEIEYAKQALLADIQRGLGL